MKKILTSAAALMIFFLAANDASAQIIVKVRPPRPRVVVTRGRPANPRQVWVEEDWVQSGRGYRWNGGHWVSPPRAGARWVPGRWDNRRGGQVWVTGRWR